MPSSATMTDAKSIVPMPPLAHRIVGAEFDLIAADGDSFTKIGSRLGEAPVCWLKKTESK